MAVTAVGRSQAGTAFTFKGSGGSAAITVTSLANAAARQSVKLDISAASPGDGTFATRFRIKAICDLAATPVAGNSIDLYWAPSDSATAGTDNPAGVSGTDAAYTGIASDLTASLRLLLYIGSMTVTADVAAQSAYVGVFSMPARYGSLVLVNNSGAAFVANTTNTVITFTPLEDTSEAI